MANDDVKFRLTAEDMTRASFDRVNASLRSIKDSASIATGALGAIGVGLSVAGIASAFKATVDQMDALNDAADQTGASIEELSSLLNTLSPYGATLSDITGVTGLLTKAMRGAEEETSTAAEAFKALGISTRDAAGNFRPTQDVLEELAKALDGYADATNKTAIAQDILGKSGAQYLPMLKDLAQAQRAAASVTTEQAQAAERFNVELGKLNRQIDAFKVALVGPVLKALNDFTEQLKVGTDAAGGFWAALAKFGLATGSPEANIERITSRIAELNEQIKRDEALARGEGSAFGRGARSAAKARVEQYRADIDAALKELQYFRLLQEQAGTSTNLRSRGLYDADGVRPQAPRKPRDDDDAQKAAQEMARARRELDELIAKSLVEDELKEEAEAAKRAADELKRYVDELERAEGINAESLRRALEPDVAGWEQVAKYLREIRGIDPSSKQRDAALGAANDLLNSGAISFDEYEKLGSKILGLVDPVKAGTKEATDAARELGLTFTSAFEDAVLGAKKFSDILAGLAQDVARFYLRQQITSPLLNILSGNFDAAKEGSTIIGSLFGMAGGGGPELLNKSAAPVAAKSASRSIVVQQSISYGGNDRMGAMQLAERVKADTLRTWQDMQARGAM